MKLVQITVGIVATILTLVILLFVGLGEPNRMAAEEASQLGKSIEEGALLFGEYCKPCHGPQAKGIEGLCPPLNDQYFFTGRLKDVGYPGSLRDYVKSTIAGGRLVSTRPNLYAGSMPPWAQDFGGPLRPDQINNLTDFVINFEKTAGQEMGMPTPTPEANDPVSRGQAIVLGKGTCSACHKIEGTAAAGVLGPELSKIGSIAETRVAGQSAADYIKESIVNPSAFLSPGFADNLMTKTFGQTLTADEINDMVTYLSTLK